MALAEISTHPCLLNASCKQMSVDSDNTVTNPIYFSLLI